MAPLDLEVYKDFVLKLKIKALDGSSQIRRVRLPRIADKEGKVSYHELVGLVVTFTFPSAGSGSPENFICSLTYFDEDEDTITIASTDELVDAVEQFADKKTLRITTEVKPIKQATPLNSSTSSTTSSNRTDRGTSTGEPSVQPQLQNVLDSFVGVLATAVNSLEREFNKPQPLSGGSRPTTQAGKKSAPRSAKQQDASKPANAEASVKKEEKEKASPPVVKSEPVAQQVTEGEEFVIGEARSSNGQAKFVKAFVHSRHTCDSCLRTPILGKRFRALELPDYDLCESCFKNYSGKETKFEELPSKRKVDRLQFAVAARKQERFSRMSSNKPAEAAKTPEQKVAPPPPAPKTEPSTPAVEAKPEPKTEPSSPTEESVPFIHGRHTCDMCLKTPIIGKRFKATNIKDYDLCENCHANYCGTEIEFEAVELQRDRAFQKRWQRRRENLERQKARRDRRNRNRPCRPSAPAPTPHPPPVAPSHDVSPPSAEIADPPATTSQVIPIQTSAPTEDEFDGALKEAIRRSLQDIQPMEDPKPNEEEIAIVPKNVDQIPKEDIYADAVEENTEIPAAENLDSKPSPVPSAPEEEHDVPSAPEVEDVDEEAEEKVLVEAMEKLETMSVDSEKMTEDEDLDKKPAAVDRETSTSTPDRKPAAVDRGTSGSSPNSAMDESFALDAVGNGDIAEAVGATLDAVAKEIAEMLFEADSHNDQKPTAETTEPEEQPTEIVVDAEEDDEKEGALIVTPGEDANENETEDDEWQVVNEAVEGDNEIAHATQMLGSALFNSDMRGSVEHVENDVSELTNSDCFSAATSVPSTVQSISVGFDVSSVSPSLRWASQLGTLRELGFDDEKMCIEHLERLQAANIGCNEKDEPSVTQVVNAILGQN